MMHPYSTFLHKRKRNPQVCDNQSIDGKLLVKVLLNRLNLFLNPATLRSKVSVKSGRHDLNSKVVIILMRTKTCHTTGLAIIRSLTL